MTQLIPVKQLLDHKVISTTQAPQGRGNSGQIWPIIVGGQIIKTYPVNFTPDAMTLRALLTLDQAGIDRATAMRFGTAFVGLVLGNLDLLPDVVLKLEDLIKHPKVSDVATGTLQNLLEMVKQLAPPETS